MIALILVYSTIMLCEGVKKNIWIKNKKNGVRRLRELIVTLR